jgi:hypothetical protein
MNYMAIYRGLVVFRAWGGYMGAETTPAGFFKVL